MFFQFLLSFGSDRFKRLHYERLFPVIFSLVMLAACNTGQHNGEHAAVDTAAIKKAIASVPVLSPEESIRKMNVEEGFEIK